MHSLVHHFRNVFQEFDDQAFVYNFSYCCACLVFILVAEPVDFPIFHDLYFYKLGTALSFVQEASMHLNMPWEDLV